MDSTIPLFKVGLDPDAALAALEPVLRSGYIGQGSKVEEFEAALRVALQAPRDVLTVNSCTSAIDLALHLCGVGPGTSVITTPMTCLGSRTPVLMADGTTERIGDIVNSRAECQVMAMGADGRLVPRDVTNWIKLPSAGVEWFRLRVKHGRGSRGPGGKFGIWITGDHRVKTTRGWVRVDGLTESDQVQTSQLLPNIAQRELIDGTMLGDASLKNVSIGQSRLEWGHCEAQAEWSDLKAAALDGVIGGRFVRPATEGHQSVIGHRSRSGWHWSLERGRWYTEGKKIVPRDLELTPRVLAAWYMDDGSYQNGSATLCTDNFSHEGVWRLFWKLADLGFRPTVRLARKESLRLNIGNGIEGHNSARKFFELVAPYIPPSMRYKLPDGMAEYDPTLWELGDPISEFDDVIVERGQPPISTGPNWVYCLEVEEDHNFIAGGMVVSNCAATNVHIVNRGAVPIWADIDPVTGLIDPIDVASKVRADTRAIIAVDWAGRPCNYRALRVAAARGSAGPVPIVQDAAHSYLARFAGRAIAESGGDFVTWSFQAIKHLTAGDGGALLCPDDETTERARLLRWYGLDRRSKADFRADQDIEECGYKYHMNDISAAIGLSNMRDAEFAVMASRHCAGSLTFALEGCPGITLPPPDPGMSWWLYTILCDDPRDLSQHLAKDGIISSGVHKRNDLHPAFIRAAGETKPGDLPGVDHFASHELAIPCGSWVSDADVARIARSIRQWAENRERVSA